MLFSTLEKPQGEQGLGMEQVFTLGEQETAEKVSPMESLTDSEAARGKRRRQKTQNLMPGVESEALEAKRLAILAASKWIGTGNRREGGLKMKEL